MGAITNVVRRYVPATHRAMVEVTQASLRLYTTSDLQALADYVKFRLFSTSAVAMAAEASAYDPLLLQFLGKLTTLQFIPAGIDYWDSQLSAKTTTGTNEVLAYRDHRDSLWRLYEELAKQVAEEFVELGPEYGFVIYGTKGLIPRVSYGDNGRQVLLTIDPQQFAPSYDIGTTSDLLPWGDPS